MFFNNIIFDLDNTLYDYDKCHKLSLSKIIDFLSGKTKLDKDNLLSLYNDVDKETKTELQLTSSSHNKMIYFRKISDHIDISNSDILEMNNIYWQTFLSNINPFEGVLELFEFLRNINIKINILTDYNIENQFLKLEKLGITKYLNKVITSEEIGIEKPSEKAFLYCLNKCKSLPEKTIMIGDNFKKDIVGSKKVGIYPFWFTESRLEITKEYTKFNNYNELLNLFKSFQKDLNDLKTLSKHYGQRFDLIQAGGGNISVKSNNLMFIKSSGLPLSDVSLDSAYSVVENDSLSGDINKKVYNDINTYNLFGKRPSMETYMHSFLKKYTVHLHPIQCNKILVRKDFKEIVKEVLPEALLLDYTTPGVDLSMIIKDVYNGEEVILLANHGIIVTTDNLISNSILVSKVLSRFESYLDIDFSSYKLVNDISYAIYDVMNKDFISYLTDIKSISRFSTFPDKVIFCGNEFLYTKEESLYTDVEEYIKKNNDYPKVVVINNFVYTVSKSINGCRDIESILKALSLTNTHSNISTLSENDCNKLTNLESEKYRKNI